MHYFGINDLYNATAILDRIIKYHEDMGTMRQGLREELENDLATDPYNGDIYQFVLARYPGHDYLLRRDNDPDDPYNPNRHDPDEGIMDYGTCSFGTREEIQLNQKQIQQIQSCPKPELL